MKSRHVFYFIAELVERVVLLGGSALSPWAIQRDPLTVKHRVAQQTGCPGNVEADDIAPCLRLRSLEELLSVHLDPPRFTSGFAPFVDGAVMPPPINQVSPLPRSQPFHPFFLRASKETVYPPLERISTAGRGSYDISNRKYIFLFTRRVCREG